MMASIKHRSGVCPSVRPDLSISVCSNHLTNAASVCRILFSEDWSSC